MRTASCGPGRDRVRSHVRGWCRHGGRRRRRQRGGFPDHRSCDWRPSRIQQRQPPTADADHERQDRQARAADEGDSPRTAHGVDRGDRVAGRRPPPALVLRPVVCAVSTASCHHQTEERTNSEPPPTIGASANIDTMPVPLIVKATRGRSGRDRPTGAPQTTVESRHEQANGIHRRPSCRVTHAATVMERRSRPHAPIRVQSAFDSQCLMTVASTRAGTFREETAIGSRDEGRLPMRAAAFVALGGVWSVCGVVRVADGPADTARG